MGSGSRNGGGKNGSSNGTPMVPREEDLDDEATTGESDDAEDEPPFEPMTGEVSELASSCVRYVFAKTGVQLDFTRDTLSVLDLYVASARAELAAKPDSLELLQATIGAYFGEVVRREHRGLYKTGPDYEAWRVRMTRVFLSFNPIGMAREALLLDSAEGWGATIEVDPSERDALVARLGAMPEVEEEEYYAPTTRLEVIDVAVDFLLDALRREGHAGTRFGADDYE